MTSDVMRVLRAGLPALLVMDLAGSSQTLPSACPDGADSDRDGLSDECESTLSARFAPVLVVSEAACNWNPSVERLDGAYLFGVHPTSDGARLVYMPAYLMDCGWSGPKCLLRWRGGCDPHPADSEIVMVDVARGASDSSWRASRVFLSAHCFGNSDGDCRWFDPSELEWLGDQVFVWVAEGKNANYRSRSACDSGHWRFDTCDRNGTSFRFPIQSPSQNIGSDEVPFPNHSLEPACLTAGEIDLLPTAPGTECVWTDEVFRGWAGPTATGVTGYRRHLTEIAGLTGGVR